MYPHTNRRKNNDAKINNKCSNEDKNNNNVKNYSTESVTQSEQEIKKNYYYVKGDKKVFRKKCSHISIGK